MNISGIDFEDDLDADGHMQVKITSVPNYGEAFEYIDETDAYKLIAHLKEVFAL